MNNYPSSDRVENPDRVRRLVVIKKTCNQFMHSEASSPRGVPEMDFLDRVHVPNEIKYRFHLVHDICGIHIRAAPAIKGDQDGVIEVLRHRE